MAKKVLKRVSNNPDGRPKLPESERKTENIIARCNAADKRKIEANAKAAGVSVSEWVISRSK